MRFVRLGGLACALWFSGAAMAAATEGKPAPAIEARLLDGSPFSLAAQSGKSWW